MATHTIDAGKIAAHDITLTAGEVDTFTFTDDVSAVEIISDGAAKAYYTLDGSTPTVGGDNTRILPGLPSGSVLVDMRTRGAGTDVIKVISNGTPTLSVQRGD